MEELNHSYISLLSLVFGLEITFPFHTTSSIYSQIHFTLVSTMYLITLASFQSILYWYAVAGYKRINYQKKPSTFSLFLLTEFIVLEHQSCDFLHCLIFFLYHDSYHFVDFTLKGLIFTLQVQTKEPYPYLSYTSISYNPINQETLSGCLPYIKVPLSIF